MTHHVWKDGRWQEADVRDESTGCLAMLMAAALIFLGMVAAVRWSNKVEARLDVIEKRLEQKGNP